MPRERQPSFPFPTPRQQQQQHTGPLQAMGGSGAAPTCCFSFRYFSILPIGMWLISSKAIFSSSRNRSQAQEARKGGLPVRTNPKTDRVPSKRPRGLLPRVLE